jgi:peptidyl-prolyl cis-trans isomerase SurA
MKSKALLLICAAVLLIGLAVAPARSQQRQVVDEVIAQVNDEIITLSNLKAATKRQIEALKQQGKTEAQATADANAQRDQLLSVLITEQLLMQKGKELGFAAEVEEEVNRRLAEAATINQTSTGRLEEFKPRLRLELMSEKVFESEVDAKVFFKLTLNELQEYYNAHKEKFRRPESVTLSEILLRTHGSDELRVRAKAETLVTQLRGGADFRKLAIANSEREKNGKRMALTDGGKVGTFQLPMLRKDLAAAIKDVKTGGVTDPIKSAEGYQILRVDERTPLGNPVFNQDRVREAITIERSPQAHAEYLQRLRAEAYIEIAKEYQSALTSHQQ